MGEPKEKTFVGIDPVTLKAMNADLAGAMDLLGRHLPKLRSDFAKVSLDLTPIDRLASVLKWIQNDLPMLKRRQVLAEQLRKESLQLGHTPSMVRRESAGNFPSTEAAVARARELAAKYVDPGELPAEVWAEIAANQNDPDFAAAFAKALGPDAARKVVAGLGHDTENPDRLPALAQLFATASHHQVFDDSWFPKFPAVPGILPLMKYGNWDNDLLVRAGNLALRADQFSGDNKHTAEVLAVVARSPIAATRLYGENFDQIQKMSRAQFPGWINPKLNELGDPLGTFIKAATVDARSVYEGLRPVGNATWPNPAEELTRRLLMDLKDNPRRAAFSGVQGAYTSIATEYFDDLNAAVAGPPVPQYYNQADPARPGIEAPDAAWSALVQQAMWDPKNAAYLNTLFRAKYEENSNALAVGEVKTATFANNFSHWQNGRFRSWSIKQLNTVKAAASKEAADYNANVKKWVDYFVDPANAAVFATGGVSGAASAAGKTITGFVKTSGTNSVKAMILGWFDRTPQEYAVDTAWAGDNAVWQNMARARLSARDIKPVTDSAGTTWTGDPGFYEQAYGAKFTTGDPEDPVIAIDKMSPAAQRAYAAWLQDPAVQQAAWDNFQADVLGRQGG